MEARANQTNFQLIVITHDEHFAQQIGTRFVSLVLPRAPVAPRNFQPPPSA